jgi:uncharacterized coiled-coil protein SlyX
MGSGSEMTFEERLEKLEMQLAHVKRRNLFLSAVVLLAAVAMISLKR